ncbi:cryptochrome/photolyase family protein [Pseudooceanicola aestuarii]|uniref:cryptochrome/photolyase family protein n=1 Tax=Pseudooceanicola aestuarii TaxID=2697319 RepID=UPI0019535CBE|nr:deoxyribodipyrimidine photo-lyase [Pseudooceanicola aestuarii]
MPAPVILWLRRDLRLSDHPALAAALAQGAPVIPVFIRDAGVDGLGAAPKFRLGLSLQALAGDLEAVGSRLILRAGPAREVLEDLARQTGAGAVHWSRLYDPETTERDSRVKSALRDAGLRATSHAGHLLFEPWEVETGQGGYYKVFTPMWRNVKDRDLPQPRPAPAHIPAPDRWPDSDRLADWQLGAAMDRGAAIVARHVDAGEAAALARLSVFIRDRAEDYARSRDFPGRDGTSDLSDHLSLGEISPRRCWHAALRAAQDGKAGAETFRKELVWREFAYHLMYHTPQLLDANWRPEWDGFDWDRDARSARVRAWKQGRTGVPFVDAAMRQMYVTGRMHNRARMIAASYLTKHLLCHWSIGAEWFRDCLVDWDVASNALGWQWVAGSGPDAAPYFRIFNPDTQAAKFDPGGSWRRAWIAEGQADPPQTARSWYAAIPRHWALSPDQPYPEPVVSLSDGRRAALEAYARHKVE